VDQREQNSLNLRKEKHFENIMKKRFSSYENEGGCEFTIEDFEKLPDDIKIMFDNTEDKITLIRKWINNDISDISEMQFDGLNYELKKYAIMNLRLYSEDFKPQEDEELVLEESFVKELLSEFCESNDNRIVYELSTVFLNLGYVSKSFSKYVMDPFIFQKIFNKTHSTYSNLVVCIFMFLGNTIIDHGITRELLYSIPIVNRVKEILHSKLYPKKVLTSALRIINIISTRISSEDFTIVNYI
jgi:hypothetical protein